MGFTLYHSKNQICIGLSIFIRGLKLYLWKRAARGWAKKAKDNLAAFKANKTKHTEPYTVDCESILPDHITAGICCKSCKKGEINR